MKCKELGEWRRQRAKRVLNWAIVYQLKCAKVKEIKKALEAKTQVRLSSSSFTPRALELLDEEVCTGLPHLPCLLLFTC